MDRASTWTTAHRRQGCILSKQVLVVDRWSQKKEGVRCAVYEEMRQCGRYYEGVVKDRGKSFRLSWNHTNRISSLIILNLRHLQIKIRYNAPELIKIFWMYKIKLVSNLILVLINDFFSKTPVISKPWCLWEWTTKSIYWKLKIARRKFWSRGRTVYNWETAAYRLMCELIFHEL